MYYPIANENLIFLRFSSLGFHEISLSGIYDTTNLVVLKFSTTVSEMTDEQIEIGLKIIKENDQSLSELIHKQAIRYTHCQQY